MKLHYSQAQCPTQTRSDVIASYGRVDLRHLPLLHTAGNFLRLVAYKKPKHPHPCILLAPSNARSAVLPLAAAGVIHFI
jgi:hypothetical protein